MRSIVSTCIEDIGGALVMRVFSARLRKSTRSFGSAEGGAVAIIFALALFPLIALVGSGIDYSNASSIRTNLQAAVDATGLAISKSAPSQTEAQVQAAAASHFHAVFNRPDVQPPPTVTAVYSATPTPSVTITGTGSVRTLFMGIIGINRINISANTKVKWGNTKLRVAMALDVTLSMASAGKMTALKTAAKSFLTQMQSAATNNGDIYVSIIPFNKDVNVGATNYTQTWVKWTDWDEVNGECSDDDYETKTKCLSKGKRWTADNHSSWNGCVMDRDMAGGDHDTKNTAPVAATPATLFPAEEYSSCPAQLMALSFNWTTLKAKIDALQPIGNTNQGIGLVWAYQSLTAAPFVIPAKDPNYFYKQVIILMTDGANTASRHYPSGPAASIDAREAITCQNAKTLSGIIIYTVQVATGGEAKIPMLEACATDPSKFFMLTSANDMVTTFNKIATELKDLHIAQ
jgi:Flp pilus assembly protein TadG